jgi:AraC-like DNA-binding protein
MQQDRGEVQHVVTDQRARRVVSAALGSEVRVSVGETLTGVLSALECSGAAVLVLSASGGARDEFALATLHAELRRRAPKLVLIVLLEDGEQEGALRDVVGGDAMLSIDCQGADGLARLRDTIAAARREARLQASARALSRGLHADVIPLVQQVVMEAFAPLTVDSLTQRIPLARSTVLRRVQRHLGLTLQQLICWGRAVAGITELESTLRKVESVAFALGYEDASGFTKLCRGCVGMPPTEVRAAGGTDVLVRTWRARVGRGTDR